MTELARQMAGYRLTTAEILYHMPDSQQLLQTYVWQDYDLVPAFPVLRKFLTFWRTNLDGRLHSVRVAHTPLLTTGAYRAVDGVFQLH